MAYTHLTQDERYQIAILVKANHCQSAIAQLMNIHKSTISREMRRNKGLHGYRPKQAHQLSQSRMIARENGPRVAICAPVLWASVDAFVTERVTW